VEKYGLESSDSREGQLPGSCEDGSELCVPYEAENFLTVSVTFSF